jgi:hypothetical protein
MFQKIKVLFILLFYGLHAQSQNNSLVIFSASGNPFYLSVNHEPINKHAESNIKVFDLAAGWNAIDIKVPGIIKELRIRDSVLLSDQSKFLNKEFTYALVETNNKLELQFKCVSERSGPLVPPVPPAPKEASALIDSSTYGNVYKVEKGKPVFFINYDAENASCKTELNEKDIEYIVKLLNNSRSEGDKAKNIKQLVEANCFKTYQLKPVLELLSIDIDRLSSAKQAYPHLIDKENANSLNTTFKYQSMKESFASFVKEQEDLAKQKKMTCTTPVSSEKFKEVFSKIKNSGYEYEQLAAVKKILVSTCISSEQAKTILSIFTHDRERLEFLQSAYIVMTDKENAKVLADELQFSETKKDFLNYISK